ncbi:MAG: PEP-CTERM sorting domain-containing protein [Phycisphaerales bacterium]|nr:PEP-CTERM sorting domain-containing protein [Phycisphaerales bacterium]
MGQTFIPSLSSVDFVELQMFDASHDSNGGSVFVRIREESMSGDVVGTSPIVFLEDCFQFPAGPGCGMIATVVAPVRFGFIDSVPLTAGQSYLIEVIHAGGDLLGVAFGLRNQYMKGAGFYDGSEGFSAGVDLTFREGVIVPEPTSVALLAAGVLAAVGGRWRRCRVESFPASATGKPIR